MSGDRVERMVSTLLGEAEAAALVGDWVRVEERCRAVLALQPGQADAVELLAAAARARAVLPPTTGRLMAPGPQAASASIPVRAPPGGRRWGLWAGVMALVAVALSGVVVWSVVDLRGATPGALPVQGIQPLPTLAAEVSAPSTSPIPPLKVAATPQPAAQPFPRRTQSRQEDRCGSLTVVREAGPAPYGSDHLSVFSPEGVSILDVPSFQQSNSGSEPYSSVFTVDTCYDVDGDGTMDLIASHYFFGAQTTLINTVVYTFGASGTKLADLGAVQVAVRDLDGVAPAELVGSDRRWKYYASSGASSRYPIAVIHVTAKGAEVVTRDYPAVVEADREKAMAELAPCLEVVRTAERFGGFDDCHAGALIAIMVDSLNLGDWDTFRKDSRIDGAVADRLDACRTEIVELASSLTVGQISNSCVQLAAAKRAAP